jgi:SAM-dependent methyltransferase
MRSRAAFDLALISWFVLFLELACIRWFPSHVMFLTFFTNIVLLACFVGMSVGCLAAKNTTRYLNATPLWLAIGLAAGLLVENQRSKLFQLIAVGDRENPDVVFFGVEAGDTKLLPFRIPVEFLAGLFFLLIGTILVGPGQEMGRAFNRMASRTGAYAANLLGSLAGIATFAGCAYLELPPVFWFAAIALGLVYFLLKADPAAPTKRRPALIVVLVLVVIALSAITSGFFKLHQRETHWSPYYRIDYLPTGTIGGRRVELNEIETNLVSHQLMEPRARVPWVKHSNYAIPYLMQRDLVDASGKKVWGEFHRVLIIGAGSGNDVSRALQWLPKDAAIDAVEIDPVIQQLGAAHHPDKPYADPRVHVHLDDGRNFLRRTAAESYDLVLFALVDSLVLQLGSGNMRLESYLFTEDSFLDARRVLKPKGVCAVYNYFRHGWLAARLNQEMADAFGTPPAVLVLGDRPIDSIKLNDSELDAFTVFLAGSKEIIEPLRAEFKRHPYQLRGDRPPTPEDRGYGFRSTSGASSAPPAGSESLNPAWTAVPWKELHIAQVEPLGALPVASDDWPLLYVREPGIPLVTWRGMGLMAGLALVLVLWFLFRPRGVSSTGPSERGLIVRSFFLGAGFMLVETKAVVQMALLFGSTWMVNTVVFAAILVMSLAGTLFVAFIAPRQLELFYLGLFVTAGIGLAVPLDVLLGLDRTVQLAAAGGLVFAPIAFAGVIFATTFARSVQPDRVFGANVAGALLGGIAENASVLLGFRYLLAVAIGFYLLSALVGNRTAPVTRPASAPDPG